jgi:hydrogenase expression/formation protein HypC
MCLAIPGKILSEMGAELMRSARVDFAGVIREVSLAYVPEAKVGDYVIVHVGMAIGVIDQEEAQRVFSYLREMGELGELSAVKMDNGTVQ